MPSRFLPKSLQRRKYTALDEQENGRVAKESDHLMALNIILSGYKVCTEDFEIPDLKETGILGHVAVLGDMTSQALRTEAYMSARI